MDGYTAYGLDRFGMLEVWSVLAHDYGCYGLVTRLDRMGFRPAPSLRYDTLDEDQKLYYAAKSYDASVTPGYSRKIQRCK